jgi:hypothetical protein
MIAIRPSCEAGWRELVEMICPTAQGESFKNSAGPEKQIELLQQIRFYAQIY